MTIRSRLLVLLIPMLIVFVALISLFFYRNWYREIISSFKSHLQAIAVSTAQGMDPQKIVWINEQLQNPDLSSTELYQRYHQKLSRLKEKLPVSNLYIVHLDPAQKNEQVYLIDLSSQHKPGEVGPSEGLEHSIYYTHEPIVTPIYESKNDYRRVMTAYAPIIDANDNVIALVAADFDLKLIDQKLHNALMMIFFSAAFTIVLVIMSVFFIANKISQPVQKLKNAALAIAAGDYNENIEVKGPHELVELANTLNTMSECLQENISRLQESSLVRERMHGEYECALLLQHYILEKVVQDFKSDFLILKTLKTASTSKPYGLKLTVTSQDDQVEFVLTEAIQAGFQGMYQLVTNSSGLGFPHLKASINLTELKYSTTDSMSAPFVWSTSEGEFANASDNRITLQKGDLIFFYNQGFAKFFENHQQIQDWYGKVLRHFGSEELDLFMTMLRNELNFLAKKHHIDHDMHILTIKLK